MPKSQTAAELMQEAEAAAVAGDKPKAREAYRAATQVDPIAKGPWLKLAESYFESADYGHAVLAAEEVLHRDGSDGTAAGILAVSGLRISTSALATLREKSGLSDGTRGEAEGLARTLRELLGEPVLVPRPAEPAASGPARVRARSNAAPANTAVAAPKLPDVAPATARKRAPRPASAAENPFEKLK